MKKYNREKILNNELNEGEYLHDEFNQLIYDQMNKFKSSKNKMYQEVFRRHKNVQCFAKDIDGILYLRYVFFRNNETIVTCGVIIEVDENGNRDYVIHRSNTKCPLKDYIRYINAVHQKLFNNNIKIVQDIELFPLEEGIEKIK